MSDVGIKPQDDEVVEQPPLVTDLRTQIAETIRASKETPDGETAGEREERLRDAATGKFIKDNKDGQKRETLTLKPKPAPAPSTPSAHVAQDGQPPAAVNAPAATGAKPPVSWKEGAKAKFASLDAEVQQEILRREAEVTRGLSAQDEDRMFGKSIREITAPYTAIIQAEGGDAAKAYQMFLNYAYTMRQGTPHLKAESVANLIKLYQVDAGLLNSYLQGGNVHASAQPQPLSQQDVAQMVQAELVKQRQAQEESQISSLIDEFEAEPGHEHYQQVKALMAAILQSGQAKDLQEAYDKAIWSVPEIRSTLTASQAQAQAVDAKREAQARSDAARKAAVSVNGGPGGARPANGAGAERSLRDELRANLQAASGRI